VSDYVRGAAGGTSDVDFVSQQLVQGVVPAVISNFDAKGKFTDNIAAPPIGVEVLHNAWAWTSTPDRKYIMVQYQIINTSGAEITNLYAGIFSDWDIMDFNKNKSAYDANSRMGYCYSTEQNGLYGGIKLLSPGVANVYTIDNVDGGNGGINPFDGFDTAEKYTTLSTSRTTGGNVTVDGNDVLDVVSTGPFTIAANDTIIVAFALIAGENTDDLKSSATAAQIMYDSIDFTVVPTSIIEQTNTYQVTYFPNPATGNLYVNINSPKQGKVTLSLVDVTGRVITTQATEQGVGKALYTFSTDTLQAGMYLLVIDTPAGKEVRKVIVK